MSKTTMIIAAAFAALLLLAASQPAAAGDWTNSGGNAGRNGLATDAGPASPDIAWSGGRSSLIAWLPVTEGDRVFIVRQAKWPDQQPHDAYIVASDIVSGGELWAAELPYNSGDWIPWIAGVHDGRVYASRSGNGASVSAKMYALNVTNGQVAWVSQDMQNAGAYDGVVFAPDGDLIVASFMDIWRINAEDGTRVWHVARTGSVSGSCGGALHGDAFYVADAAVGAHILVRYNSTTGARMYQSPVMPGFTLQNTPMAGPDGTVYLCRTQNNPSVDYFYAFTDTGTQFVEKWHVASYATAFAEFGVGPDGSIYMLVPGPKLARLDPANGGVMNSTPNLPGVSSSRIAIDPQGRVFFSNCAFGTGRLYSFDADLTPRWDVAVPNINIGGPSLGRYGTLIVCGTGTDVRAYRTSNPADVADLALDLAAAPRVMNAPNPFHAETTIYFRSKRGDAVTMEIFDAHGSLVRRLLRGDTYAAGEHAVPWDARNGDGARLPSGVYYYRLAVGGEVETGRMLLAR